MALDLIELLQGFVTPDLVRRVSGLVNEPSENTERAIHSAVPAVLAGIMDTASSGPGAGKVMQIITEGGFQEKLGAFTADRPDASLSGLMTTGSSIVSGIFGHKVSLVSEKLASSTGIRQGSASSLLALAASLVMGVLGREVQSKGMSGSSLLTTLLGQSESIKQLLPSGLGSVFGAGGAAAVGSLAGTHIPSQVSYDELARRNRGSMWLPTLLLIFGSLALFTWMRSPAEQTRGRLANVSLPGGFSLRASETSMNYSLARYLGQSSDTQTPKRFVFDNLNFGVGNADPTSESMQTISDLSSILKAYPETRVRLEGHTDNTGDVAANKELSQQRSESIKALLVQNGIDGGRIETAGYGADSPIASNDTEDGRLRNRRTELVVIQKS